MVDSKGGVPKNSEDLWSFNKPMNCGTPHHLEI